MTPQGDQNLMTPAEVAALFRVDPKTVTRWADAGKLTAVRTLGGHRRYLRELIDRYPVERLLDEPFILAEASSPPRRALEDLAIEHGLDEGAPGGGAPGLDAEAGDVAGGGAPVGLVGGLVLLVLTFASNVWVGALGFAVMLACSLVIERQARTLGRAGLQSLTGGGRGAGLRSSLGEHGRSWRERFRRDDA